MFQAGYNRGHFYSQTLRRTAKYNFKQVVSRRGVGSGLDYTNGWMDGRMDGWMANCINEYHLVAHSGPQ